MRNHRAKAAVVFALESVKINFAFLPAISRSSSCIIDFPLIPTRGVNLPSRNRNAGGAQSFGPAVYVLHMPRERLRAQPRTIANNSNRRITILIKTLSMSLYFHAGFIACG